jgi:sulfur carrier protein ThiS
VDISVTLFGGLRHFLPAGSSFNRCTLQLEQGERLDALLAKLPIPADKAYIVIINDEKVAREAYTNIVIKPDDQVVLLPPIKGG